MKNKITVVLVLISVLAMNSQAADGKKLFVEKTCVACHGAEGKKPLMKEYPKVAGQNKEYIEAQMQDIKSGKRANGNSAAMQGVMHLVSDEEIKVISEYLSKVKP